MLLKLLGKLLRPPVPFVVGTLLAVALVWFGGHVLQQGYGWPSTLLIALLCLLIVLLAVLLVVLKAVRARRQARAIENEIRNQARAQAATLPPASQGELEALQQRFDEALESLKASKLGKGALYAMPWFVIIGPPGSGKTTAITESGLNFPFMKGPNQKRGIRGLGGTRNCDWWFTDQSILLDTAGRYTTEVEDHDEWLAFLGLLKQARKLKPINGVLVALSVRDVLDADEAGIERHATTIRQRIDELVKQLEVVFPVYLVFTKCDLLDGFVEFFAALSKEERAQVWGMTFTAATAAGPAPERFAAEFDLLCRRIDQERLRLLVADRPTAQQQKILSLSLQLRAARRKLTEFVRLLTQPNPYSDASELRGVYLTSGTQEGAPIDMVLQKLSSAFGLQIGSGPGRADAQPAAAVDAKSYFIRDLFAKVIYADRELAHSSAGVQRRRELGRKAVIWGGAAAALLFAVLSLLRFTGTRSLLADLEQARLHAPAIAADRDGAPPEAAQQALGVLRDRYLLLQEAYSPTSLLGPSRAVVLAAMQDYARGVRAAFLEPAARKIEARLRDYTAGDNGLGFAANSQLVLVYAALAGEYVPFEDQLEAAVQQQNLWRWSPADIFREHTSAPQDEDRRHLAAWLAARRFDGTVWVLRSNIALLRAAQAKLNSGSQTQVVIRNILQGNATARGATEAEVAQLVVQQMEQQSGTKVELTPALQQEISAQRKTEVLGATAGIRLQDTSSLPKVLDSLDDLGRPQSAPLQTFTQNLDVLRRAGAAPRPGIGQDAVLTTYAAALDDIAALRARLGLLVASGGPGRYVLPAVLADKTEALSDFGKEWDKTQVSIERRIQQIAELMKTDGGQASAPTVAAIQASLNGMLNSIAEALAREGRNELQKHWDDNVGTDLLACAERFPSQEQAKEEVAPAAFVALLRPGGRIDQELAILDRLRGIKLLAPHLQLDLPFEELRRRLQVIQQACFDKAAPDAARLQFHVGKMNITDPVLNLVLTIAPGDSVSKQSARAETIRNAVRSWPVGKVGSQVLLETSVELPNAQRLKLSVPKDGSSPSAWGFLRLLTPTPGASDKDIRTTRELLGADVKVGWEVPFQTNAGTTVVARAWIQFEPEGVHNPLAPRFFLLEPPKQVFQADAR